ncbi:MAG: acyl carrier protein [Anaerolineales bacterium]|nr:acyl carrier protein [Anaerolineales bacterium]
MSDEIVSALSKYIAEQVLKQPQRTIAPDEKLISSGMIDSFHLVDLSLYVEDSFGVHLDDTELNAETFDSLAELAAVVRDRRKPA